MYPSHQFKKKKKEEEKEEKENAYQYKRPTETFFSYAGAWHPKDHTKGSRPDSKKSSRGGSPDKLSRQGSKKSSHGFLPPPPSFPLNHCFSHPFP
jgi:hypothetical protein